jgi:hypothetical protein
MLSDNLLDVIICIFLDTSHTENKIKFLISCYAPQAWPNWAGLFNSLKGPGYCAFFRPDTPHQILSAQIATNLFLASMLGESGLVPWKYIMHDIGHTFLQN